jgi:NADH:ubiquinone oxidoreductase subunit 4 (subunit M)
MRVVGQVFFGEFDEKKFPNVPPLRLQDKIALVLLSSWLIVVGIYPQLMSNMVEGAARPVVGLLTGGS